MIDTSHERDERDRQKLYYQRLVLSAEESINWAVEQLDLSSWDVVRMARVWRGLCRAVENRTQLAQAVEGSSATLTFDTD